MESQRVLKARKRFWVNVLIGFGIYILILFVMLDTIPNGAKVLALLGGIAMYIYGFICGYSDGQEHIKSVLDFMNPKLRWEVYDAEQAMYDKEDSDYYSGSNDYKRS